MADSSPIAERTFDLLKPNGERVRFTASFGPIYQSGPDYLCPVKFIGWGNSPPDIAGHDSVEAFLHAVSLVHCILRTFRERGGGVWYKDTDMDFYLEKIVVEHEPPG